MKFSLAILVLAALAAAAPPLQKIDNYSILQILTEDKIFQQYFDCIMERGKCSPGGQEIKDNIGEQVNGNCAKCRPDQKIGARLIINFMIAKRGPQYEEFEKKYDPQQKLRKLYAINA